MRFFASERVSRLMKLSKLQKQANELLAQIQSERAALTEAETRLNWELDAALGDHHPEEQEERESEE